MSRSWIGALCACTLLSTVIVSSPAAAAASKPGPALRSLVRQTATLPAGATGRQLQRRLLATAKLARRQARRAPCASVRSLARYRRLLSRAHVSSSRGASKRIRKRASKVAALGPASLQASRALLKGRGTRRCGGGVGASKVSRTTTTVRSSSVDGLTVQVKLPELHFVDRTGGGRTWTQLVLPDTDSPQQPGTPGVPVASTQFAVPEGATVEVDPGKVTSYELDGVDVYPAQPDSVDAITPAPSFSKPPFASQPFTFDPKAYASSGPLPAADGGVLGHARDLTIGDLQVPAVQFDPKTHKLRVLQSVEVRIDFGGKNTKKFNGELGSPWERPAQRGLGDLLNSGIVLGNLGDRIIYQPCGEELLIVTNPATLPAANALRSARSAAGFLSRVVQTGSGAGQIGTTTTQIQSYIRGQLTSRFCVHPSYVAIMGDDDLVPTFPGINGIPSDLEYSLRDGADELPDVAIGRIIGNDQAAVQTAVDKIVGYETRAPGAGTDFLTHATVAAMFQDTDDVGEVNDGQEDRTFIQFAETVRNGLVRRGVTVDRVYTDDPTTTPLRFNDGTDLPASLRKPTFRWDGSGADVTADWNAGRFLMVHRDHGWSDGWGDPFFTTTDVDALTNGSLLPVVLSINCASGQYDTDETSFSTQALTSARGGAVGVFGDTRNSPTWHNSQIALGFVDALLPSILPSEGPRTAQRMGDALVNGKLRLAGISSPTTDGNTRNELYLWHYFGDPTMQMWGGGHGPLVFDPSRFRALLQREITGIPPGPDPPPYEVRVTLPTELAGQPISLLRNGEVIGKALAGDGSVTIAPLTDVSEPKQGELQVAVEGDGAQPVSAPVTVPPPAATTLAQQCPAGAIIDDPMTVRGTLSGAPAGSLVRVTFRAPSTFAPGRTVNVDARTAADGSWSASVTPNQGELGRWTISSAYAGDAAHAASSGGPCTVVVDLPPIR